MFIQCGCLSNYCLQSSYVTNNLQSKAETLTMLESMQFFCVLSEVRIFLEALFSSKKYCSQEKGWASVFR